MHHRFLSGLLPVLLLSVFLFGTGELWGRVENAAALIRKIETQYQGETSQGKMIMVIQTSSWKRTLTMESWSEGREKFLARILDPVKERGTCTLKVGEEIWNYLPKIDRLMKIPSSLMGDKWMGSHLTNDDLVKDQKIDQLYEFTILREDARIALIQGMPRPDAPVVWGRITYEVDLEREIPMAVEYFDEDGKKARTITFSEVTRIQDRWIPRQMRIEPVENPGEFTEIRYESITFNQPLPAHLFSTQSIRKL